MKDTQKTQGVGLTEHHGLIIQKPEKLKGISIDPIAEVIIGCEIVNQNRGLIVWGMARREQFEQDMENFPYGCGI